jgi:hypothetical protein
MRSKESIGNCYHSFFKSVVNGVLYSWIFMLFVIVKGPAIISAYFNAGQVVRHKFIPNSSLSLTAAHMVFIPGA